MLWSNWIYLFCGMASFIYIFHCINLMIIETIQEVNAIGVKINMFSHIVWVCDQYKLKAEAERNFLASSEYRHVRFAALTIFHIIFLSILLTFSPYRLFISHSLSPLPLHLPLVFSSPSPLHVPFSLHSSLHLLHLFISPIDCSPNLLFKPCTRILFLAPFWFCCGLCFKNAMFFSIWFLIGFVDSSLYFFFIGFMGSEPQVVVLWCLVFYFLFFFLAFLIGSVFCFCVIVIVTPNILY